MTSLIAAAPFAYVAPMHPVASRSQPAAMSEYMSPTGNTGWKPLIVPNPAAPGQTSGLSWVGDQLAPSGEIFASVLDSLGGGQEVALRLSFADDELMVWRAPRLGDHFFVLVRGDEGAWPAMEELRRRQASGQQRSRLGSAAALGMLNPFFSRALGRR